MLLHVEFNQVILVIILFKARLEAVLIQLEPLQQCFHIQHGCDHSAVIQNQLAAETATTGRVDIHGTAFRKLQISLRRMRRDRDYRDDPVELDKMIHADIGKSRCL